MNAVCIAGSDVQTFDKYLKSLANTGRREKVCNICFKEKPIDSHVITERVLEEACGDREWRSIMLVDRERNSLTISTPAGWVEKLECERCDRSTSKLEGKFFQRLNTYYTPSTTKLHREDAQLFLVYTYRFLSMRDVFRYAENKLCSYDEYKLCSYDVLKEFMEQVWTFRRDLLHRKETEIDSSAIDRVLFYVFTQSETDKCNYRIIIIPRIMDLSDVDPDLGRCPLIYFKALHCCLAVLLGEHKAANIQKHFRRMIDSIDNKLSQKKVEPRGIVEKDILEIKV